MRYIDVRRPSFAQVGTNTLAMHQEHNIAEFDRDVCAYGGYQYTMSGRLSCRLSNQRLTDVVLALAQPRWKRIIDVGCGDGTHTMKLAAAGASAVLGLDASTEAIAVASRRAREYENVRFDVLNVYQLNAFDQPYDVAVVRGILHHLYDAPLAVERIARVARQIVVVEPNGWNPVLKMLEKLSPYHVQHEEKSYSPCTLDRWFANAGCRLETSRFVGLVPIFCPDRLAQLLKYLEPLVEKTPLLRVLACGQYVQSLTSVNCTR